MTDTFWTTRLAGVIALLVLLNGPLVLGAGSATGAVAALLGVTIAAVGLAAGGKLALRAVSRGVGAVRA